MYAVIILMLLLLVGCQSAGDSESTQSPSYDNDETSVTEAVEIQDLNISEDFGFQMQKQVEIEISVMVDSSTVFVEVYGRTLQPEHQLARLSVSEGTSTISTYVPISAQKISLLQFDLAGNEIGLKEIELNNQNQELFFQISL